MRKLSCFVFVGVLLIIGSCNKPNMKVKLTSQIDTVSYYIGILSAKNLQTGTGLEKINSQAVAMGFEKVFSKDSIRIPEMEMQKKLHSYFA